MPVVNLGKFTPKKRDPEDKIGRFIDELLLSTEFTSLMNPITMYKNTLPYIPKALEQIIPEATKKVALSKASGSTIGDLLGDAIKDEGMKAVSKGWGKTPDPLANDAVMAWARKYLPTFDAFPFPQTKSALTEVIGKMKNPTQGWLKQAETLKNMGTVPDSLLGTPISYQAGKALSEADRFLPQMLAAISALTRKKKGGDEEDAMQR